MAYITTSNFKRIIKKTDLKNIDDLEGQIYRKPIYFFSKWEKDELLSLQELMKDPEKFIVEIYKPIDSKDTYTYVYESKNPPAYHSSLDCERLNSDFKNFQVPSEVKERARIKAKNEGLSIEETEILIQGQVEKFREWFKAHLEIFENEPELFLKKLATGWLIERRIEEIEKSNSGVIDFDNLSLNELEAKIDELLKAAGRFYYSERTMQYIIRRFAPLTFLAYTKKRIVINDTELSDDELKEFLEEYDKKFKRPVKDLLLHYYRVKFNPDLSFEGWILDRLNFSPCYTCRDI